MKKIVVSLLLLCTVVFNTIALTACPGGYIELDLTGAYDGSDVTITFTHSMGQDNRAVLDDAIARFNKIYPNIHVEHSSLGDYDTVFKTVQTQLTGSGEKYPNFAFCYPDHVATYNRSESTICLDDLINSTAVVAGTNETMGFSKAQLDDFIEVYYNEGKSYGDGKMYSLPFQKSTEVLYYNATVFEELGLEEPKTWDDVYNCAVALKNAYPNSTPIGYDSEENFFITLCEQSNTAYTDASKDDPFVFVNDENKAIMAKFAEWYKSGLFTTSSLASAGTGQTSSYTSDYFTKGNDDAGKIFMSIGSSAGARYQRPDKVNGEYPFEVGVAPVPQENEANKKVISQGPSVCIFEKSNVQEVYASWLLIKFLLTDMQFQTQYAMKSGYVPVIKSVLESDIYQKHLAKADGGDYLTASVAVVTFEQEDYYFFSDVFDGSVVAREQVGLLVNELFSKYEIGKDNSAIINKAFENAYDRCQD